ncbi:Glycosyltransferase sdnJ [Zalerion maritima]|uniref:Glycosyltransferase sdnJ n=1 Tax=Zalerion maritima TaxID=339359 RepID=A0AAD5WU10_9PEZI|nr:Glycosyltransferase sdnJ [Zalerion maritima]
MFSLAACFAGLPLIWAAAVGCQWEIKERGQQGPDNVMVILAMPPASKLKHVFLVSLTRVSELEPHPVPHIARLIQQGVVPPHMEQKQHGGQRNGAAYPATTVIGDQRARGKVAKRQHVRRDAFDLPNSPTRTPYGDKLSSIHPVKSISYLKKILLPANSDHDLSNVFLAITHALLYATPPPNLHTTSSEYLQPLVSQCSDLALKTTPEEASEVSFHMLSGLSLMEIFKYCPGFEPPKWRNKSMSMIVFIKRSSVIHRLPSPPPPPPPQAKIPQNVYFVLLLIYLTLPRPCAKAVGKLPKQQTGANLVLSQDLQLKKPDNVKHLVAGLPEVDLTLWQCYHRRSCPRVPCYVPQRPWQKKTVVSEDEAVDLARAFTMLLSEANVEGDGSARSGAGAGYTEGLRVEELQIHRKLKKKAASTETPRVVPQKWVDCFDFAHRIELLGIGACGDKKARLGRIGS